MLRAMKAARMLWVGLLGGLCWLSGAPYHGELGPRQAAASVSVALSLQELVDGSSHAVEAVATERRSTWKQVDGSRRIVTYTTVRVVQTAYGTAPTTFQVRTLGGVVGKIGQHVSGEAQLAVGKPCLLFLTPLSDTVHVVTGRAQGHYPIVTDDEGVRRLRPSPDRGRVVPRHGPTVSAYEALVRRPVPKAFEAIRHARRERDAPR